MYIVFLFLAQYTLGQCDSVSGPMDPSTAIDQSFTGSNFAFSNPTYVFASDNSYATATGAFTLFFLSGKTDYLIASNFNFNIPVGATICGITVDIEKSSANIVNLLSSIEDNVVSLVMNGALTGNNEATTSAWPSTDSWTSYGSSSDTWGTAWTPADVNSPNFGVAVSAEMTGTLAIAPSAKIDNITVTITYSYSSLLPIQLSAFQVSSLGNSEALIKWTSELNQPNSVFLIERSAGGNSWLTIDSVKALQEETASNTYEYIDPNPLNGESYYRIAVLSSGMTAFVSPVQSLRLSAGESLRIYPNPASDYLVIDGKPAKPPIRLVDVYGNTYPLYYRTGTAGNSMLDIRSLQPGIYFLQINNQVLRFIKI